MLKKILIISILALIPACSNPFSKKVKTDEGQEIKQKKERKVYNVREKVNAAETGVIFGGKKKDILGGQNIMWKATLNILDFMPIVSASYDGGLIVTDWYSSGNSDESVKINVSFTSNEVSASSIVVKSFKKICKNGLNCKTVKTGEDFNKKIKDQILAEVREINSRIN